MTKPLIATRPVSKLAASAARVSIVSGLLFVVLLLSLHLLEPEFDPKWRFISEYELGDFGLLMSLSFIALATSLTSAAIALFSQVRKWHGYIGLGLLGLASIGLVLAAIFKTDPIYTSQEAATFSGKMHVLGASLDWSPIGFLLIAFSLSRTEAWKPVRKWLFTTAAITILATIAFVLSLPHDGRFGPDSYSGLVGRFMIASYLGWLLVAGVHALNLHKQTKIK